MSRMMLPSSPCLLRRRVVTVGEASTPSNGGVIWSLGGVEQACIGKFSLGIIADCSKSKLAGFEVAGSRARSPCDIVSGRPRKKLNILRLELAWSTSLQTDEWKLIGYSICQRCTSSRLQVHEQRTLSIVRERLRRAILMNPKALRHSQSRI